MAQTANPKAQDITADETLRRRLDEFVKMHGLKQAAVLTEVSPSVVTKILAGLPVRRASLKSVRAELDKLAPLDTTETTKGTYHGHE